MGVRFPLMAKQSSATLGPGAYELNAPTTGFVSFVAALGNGGKGIFTARDGANRETFIGTVTAGTPDTLARTKIIWSTNGNAAVNWTDGVRDIYCVGLPGAMGYVSFTDTGTLQAGDMGALVRLAHADAKTLTLPALADVYESWAVEIENRGAGTWTLDGAGSEQIDGAATKTLLAGESAVLLCTGTGWTLARIVTNPAPPAQVNPAVAVGTYTANTAINTTIPYDNSKPQSGEGTEIIAVAFTPKQASSKIRISFSGYIEGAAANVILALFKDSDVNAFYAIARYGEYGGLGAILNFDILIDATNTTARTYKLRVGTSNGAHIRFNGTTAGPMLDGAPSAQLIVQEILV